MAYVQPNSIIQLFQGINLDNRYLHTIYFASESAQNTWFTSKVFKTYQNQSYTRYNKKQIKLKADTTELFGVSYMRFKNDRTIDKWFYAFVLGVEYVNENTCLITYEIDVMQTWFIQAGTIRPCFIKREHANDDTFGINLESEPVGSEAYDFTPANVGNTSINHTGYFANYSVIISSSAEPTNGFDWGLYCGTKLKDFPCDIQTDCQDITDEIYNMLGSWDLGQQSAELVDLYTFPTHFLQDTYPFSLEQITINHPASFGGYTPKNKKLYSYPFSYLFATTMSGDSEMYRWEYWAGHTVGSSEKFALMGNPLGGGMVMCYPRDYNGITEDYDMALVIDNFPKNSANIDAYQAWVAAGNQTRLQNAQDITQIRNTAKVVSQASESVSTAVNSSANMIMGAGLVSSGVGTGVGVKMISNATNDLIQTGVNAVNTEQDIREANYKISYQWKDIAYEPNVVKGKNTPNLSVSRRFLDFYFYAAHVRNDEAKRIDEFFSIYGYATNKVKTPNLTGRQYWNFVQTENAVIDGNMPSSSKEAIGRIFDGGITFWHNGDQIGNYAQSTSDGSINNPILV